MEALQKAEALFDALQEQIGYEELAKEMFNAMNVDQATDILEYVAKNHEVKL